MVGKILCTLSAIKIKTGGSVSKYSLGRDQAFRDKIEQQFFGSR